MILGGIFLFLSYLPPGEFGALDFLQYWAGARIFFNGGNPYDPSLLAMIEKEAFSGLPFPVLLWNPPILLPILLPVSWLSFPMAKVAWLVAATIAYVGSLLLLNSRYRLGNKTSRNQILIIAAFAFYYPFILCLSYGQLSAFLLLSLTIFLIFAGRSGGLCRTFLGGGVLSLTLVKPHLLFLIYLYLLIQSFKERAFQTVLGLVAGAGTLVGLAWLMNSGIFQHYISVLLAPPIYWKTPTLGSWLQDLTGNYDTFTRVLPSLIVGLIAMNLLWLSDRLRNSPQTIPVLIPLSLVCAPYGWVYDQLLLLPSIFFFLNEAVKSYQVGRFRPITYGGAALLQSQLLFFLTPSSYGQEYFLWFPLLILALLIMPKGPKSDFSDTEYPLILPSESDR